MKTLKIILMLILAFCVIANITTVKASDITADSVFGGGANFLKAGASGDTVMDEDNFREVSNVVYNILLAVGIVAAVIVGLIIGIRMMLGSSTQKAETKEYLIPYIVGCVVIFGAFGIWKLVVELMNQAQ